MASSSWHRRRSRPAASVEGQASSSGRTKRARHPPSPSYLPLSPSPSSFSPTSPSYPPTSPSYSPTLPLHPPTYLSSSPTSSPPADPRYGDGVIEEEPGSEGQEDENYDGEEEEQMGSEREQKYSDGSDEDDQHLRDDDVEEERMSESEREEDYSDGSDGENGVEDEQPAAHGVPEEEEQEEEPPPLQPHVEVQQHRNGVEEEQQQAGEQEREEEEEPPQPHGEDDDAPVDGDLAVPPRASSSPAPSFRSESSAVVGEMTMDHTDALDCGICFLPLKPPIFQCDVGHVVCSPCRDKLAAGGRCHVCRDLTRFQRCHAMEKMVDAVRVPCPHAAHFCADRPAYHDRERHARECARAPCRCPAPACGFLGPAPALAEHAAAAHGWPCAAEPTPDHRFFAVHLRDGFNLITAARGGAQQHLILLNVARTPFGRAVSAVLVRPMAAGSAKCELELYYWRLKGFLREHSQTSRIEVASMDGSDALPDPSASFQFFVPKYAGGSDEEDELRVSVRIIGIS